MGFMNEFVFYYLQFRVRPSLLVMVVVGRTRFSFVNGPQIVSPVTESPARQIHFATPR